MKHPSAKLVTAFLLMGSAVAANAQKTASVWLDGAWIQRTLGPGTDRIQVAYNSALYWPGGSNSVSGMWDAGDWNDHGGAGSQEVPKWKMVNVTLSPGQTAEVVVALYGNSNGGIVRPILDLIGKAAKAGLQSGDALTTAIAAGGLIAAQAVSNEMSKGGGFIGSVRVYLWCEANGTVKWNFTPLNNASDRGWNGSSQSLTFARGRAEYWPKILVEIH